ncbi:CshA/CshB family fibrillar adhesin-related protein [uncultured Clostridium sp.]|uniref:CshA/CshB family fibrillar adhesin-related protein n=1 Tax=uncultured Clostridium sp. TaxID=59620 RepID=UPI00272F0050|nr:CshA/CshB family fibrillar adhesin-related protein [uncultured Clostridium sp.]
MINSVKYAEKESGALADLIGWIDYGKGFVVSNNQSINVVNSIYDDYKISFNVQVSFIPNAPYLTIESFIPPIFNMNNIPFGGIEYKNIDGYVVLYMPEATLLPGVTTTKLIISDINVIKGDETITNYVIFVADIETTNHSGNVLETLTLTTNGDKWGLLDIMSSSNPNGKPPKIEGLGTTVVKETGIKEGMSLVKSPVYFTKAPTELTFSFTTDGSREGVALGITLLDISECKKCINIIPCCYDNCKCCEYRCGNYCRYYNAYIR